MKKDEKDLFLNKKDVNKMRKGCEFKSFLYKKMKGMYFIVWIMKN